MTVSVMVLPGPRPGGRHRRTVHRRKEATIMSEPINGAADRSTTMTTDTEGIAYTIPRQEQGGGGWSYVATYEVLGVADADAGPCATCDKPMVRLNVHQHVNHNGYEYTHALDMLYVHADGAEAHDGKYTNQVKLRCPQCREYGTVTRTQEAYGEWTRCSACRYDHFFDIGD